jgi:cell division protein ZapA
MKRNVKIRIAGQQFTVSSDTGEATIQELARLVDDRFRHVKKQTRTADTQILALLTALQIAEDLVEERRAHKDLKRKIKQKVEALLLRLEREARI